MEIIKTRYGYKVYDKGRISIFGFKSPEIKMLKMGLIKFDSEDKFCFYPRNDTWLDHKFMEKVTEFLEKLNLQYDIEKEE